MIIILTDPDEPTTDLVIDWLYYLEKDFVRISCETPIQIKKIYWRGNEMEAIFSIEFHNGISKEIDTKDVTSYWYRRSYLKNTFNPVLIKNNDAFTKALNWHIFDELESAKNILNYIFNKKRTLNKFEDALNICKLEVLEKAQKKGIKVPKTLVCTDKKELLKFYKQNSGNIITKSIGDPTFLSETDYSVYTAQVDINLVPEFFNLSLFQELLDKAFELRIFYLRGEFFSSAIFSQSDETTRIDFKNYNKEKPNRVIPFKLDYQMESKLKSLMDELGMNSGSIDIVYTKSGDYYFLEVNPVGQFEQVSFPCNYNLFKKIAEEL